MIHDDVLVSVVVPVFQRRHCVLDAVGSVLEQTYPHVECIVVDDGSLDGTFDVVAAAGAGDPRVRVFSQAHRGVSAARNRGLREAGGAYVTFLDSDDLMPSNRVRRQLHALEELGCDAVFGRFETQVMPGVDPPAWLVARPHWARGLSWTSLLAPTASVRAVHGFDETVHLGEDADLIVRLRDSALDIRPLDDLFVVRRLFGDNLTNAVDDRTPPLAHAIRRRLARRRRLAAGQ